MASLRYGTKSYQYFQLTVKIQMLSGKPGMYAGVFITESDDYNKGFIYFVDDPSVLQLYADKAPKIYKKMVKKYGKDLKFLRFALYIKGKWHPLSEVPIAFKRGQYVELKVEHFNGFLSTWINNRPVYRMRTRPFMGRVGLVKYYDAHVRYKDFKIRELKAP